MEPVREEKTIQINPKAGFVVKSRIVSSDDPDKHVLGTKVFINLCHDRQVPKPDQEFDPPVVFPLIIENKWEIPIIVSEEKYGLDKKGQSSWVYDCCINTECFHWCQVNTDLRSILIEWCIESIELLFGLVLDRQFSVPKMLSKGDLSRTVFKENDKNETSYERKLKSLKENEALGVLEEKAVDAETEEAKDTQLPDLMNIDGKVSQDGSERKTPLIQELNEMQINEVKTKQQQIRHVPKSDASPEKVEFSFSFQKLSGKYKLAVMFTCKQMKVAEMFKLEFIPTNNCLRFTIRNMHYYFGKTAKLGIIRHMDVPLPISFTKKESFNFTSIYAKRENIVYTFC